MGGFLFHNHIERYHFEQGFILGWVSDGQSAGHTENWAIIYNVYWCFFDYCICLAHICPYISHINIYFFLCLPCFCSLYRIVGIVHIPICPSNHVYISIYSSGGHQLHASDDCARWWPCLSAQVTLYAVQYHSHRWCLVSPRPQIWPPLQQESICSLVRNNVARRWSSNVGKREGLKAFYHLLLIFSHYNP